MLLQHVSELPPPLSLINMIETCMQKLSLEKSVRQIFEISLVLLEGIQHGTPLPQFNVNAPSTFTRPILYII